MAATTSSSSITSTREFWKDFDLVSLQKSLDSEATELATRQDESDISRKKLVELSKEFKKTTPDSVRKQVAHLLKSFQAEIDSLTKRSKASEAVFLSLYKKVVQVPDPIPVLDQCHANLQKVSKFHDYEIENKKLRETLEDYNTEFAEVKNQEVTINRLKDKVREYEDRIEETAKSRVKEKEKELQKSFAERERQLQETQLEVAKKLGETEEEVASLKAALESAQSELFDVKSKLDEENEARGSAIDLLETDVERASQRALMAERQMESLHEQLRQTKSELQMSAGENARKNNMDDAFHSISRSNLERDLSAKEKEISQLVEDIQRLQASMSKMREAATNQVSTLEDQLAGKTDTIHKLEEKLREQSDYDEIHRELSILKSVEFSRLLSADADQPDQDTTKSLEMLLLEKNRGLQSENTKLKLAGQDTSERLVDLQRQYTDAARTVKGQKELISQLEGDLLSVNSLASSVRGQGEGEAGPVSETELVATAVQDVKTSATVDISLDENIPADSLLPIISSQRERFRLRNMELEAQARHQQRQTNTLQNEIDTLRSDNVKLYEKIRFLQSYPSKGGSSRSDEMAVSKYSSQYEEKLDPFSAFNKNEKQQRYMGLSVYDKVTLNMGKFILSSKVARAVAFFYTILLHCLVFLVLYKLAHTESCKRGIAAECNKRFFEHMRMEHAGGPHPT